MAVTGQQVLELALQLIDEMTTSGKIDTSSVANKTKAVGFLTILQAELLPRADASTVIVNSLADNLALSDRECLLILPYGLAAHLVLQDDAASASFFQQRYEEMRKKKRATIGPIAQAGTATTSSSTDGDEYWDGGTF